MSVVTPELLTLQETAAMLRVSHTTIDEWAKSGVAPL
jgi:hypothetical protein